MMEHYTDVYCIPVIIMVAILPTSLCCMWSECKYNLPPLPAGGLVPRPPSPTPSWTPEPGVVLSPIYTVFPIHTCR